MAKIGPHLTTVAVELGECPACKKVISASVTASVSITALGAKSTTENPVLRLSVDKLKVEHAVVHHDCGPQDSTNTSDERLCGGAI